MLQLTKNPPKFYIKETRQTMKMVPKASGGFWRFSPALTGYDADSGKTHEIIKIKRKFKHQQRLVRFVQRTTRQLDICSALHQIQSGSLKSCSAAQNRFLLFKGPGPFKKNLKFGGIVEEVETYRLIPLMPPPPVPLDSTFNSELDQLIEQHSLMLENNLERLT